MVDNTIMPFTFLSLSPFLLSSLHLLLISFTPFQPYSVGFDWPVCWVSRIINLNNGLFFHNLSSDFHGKIFSEKCWGTMIKAIWGQRVKCQVMFEVFAKFPWFQNSVSKLQSFLFFFFLLSFFGEWVKHPLLVFKEQTFFEIVTVPSLDSLSPFWFSCDGTLIMAVILSWCDTLWCETLGWETLMGQLVEDSQTVWEWPIHSLQNVKWTD